MKWKQEERRTGGRGKRKINRRLEQRNISHKILIIGKAGPQISLTDLGTQLQTPHRVQEQGFAMFIPVGCTVV